MKGILVRHNTLKLLDNSCGEMGFSSVKGKKGKEKKEEETKRKEKKRKEREWNGIWVRTEGGDDR
jgi:hypothetical protein